MTLAARCRMITALILDVDGVLTSGDIVYTESRQEIKSFHVRDGSAIKVWQKAGKRLGLLSGRSSAVTSLRAKELGIDDIEQGNAEKGPGFHRLLKQWNVEAGSVAYVGDDNADVPIMKQVGLAIAPADACIEAMETAHLVTRQPGGHGAVREAIEWVLQSQNLWPGGQL
ncbi:MAG TPA: HAD hydrolase family protein [Gemmatales bacterium]|nr:HAD hydrolase family protein [Gemmatales bacterium]